MDLFPGAIYDLQFTIYGMNKGTREQGNKGTREQGNKGTREQGMLCSEFDWTNSTYNTIYIWLRFANGCYGYVMVMVVSLHCTMQYIYGCVLQMDVMVVLIMLSFR
jgi:hypothetical protein